MSSHNRSRKAVLSRVTLHNIIAQCLSPRLRPLCYHAAVNKLPDDVLLDIFDFYLNDPDRIQSLDEWHTLVHVCRRWRNVVFASPRRLNLRLLCNTRRPVRALLDTSIWSAFQLPIVIEDDYTEKWEEGLDNIIAALEHSDRVRSVELNNVSRISSMRSLAMVMQVPFPELTHLDLCSSDGCVVPFPFPFPFPFPSPFLSESFLGGSAPRLRTLKLRNISFPAVPNLLLSATDLVDLSLWHLPHSGYISPASMVACLSSLNKLKSLSLGFRWPPSLPDQPSPPPQTRVVLPALTNLAFEGMTDYSEDLLARIDTPVLDKFSMSFFLVLVDIPHFKLLIDRAEGLKPPKAATLLFDPSGIRLELDRPHGSMLGISHRRVERQIDSMARVCRQLSLFFSLVERLDLVWDYSFSEPQGEDGVVSAQIVGLFQPFAATQSLHVSRSLVPLMATALQELIGERATDVLPNLRDLFIGGSAIPGAVQEAIQSYVITRRLSGQPVAVHRWEGSTADR